MAFPVNFNSLQYAAFVPLVWLVYRQFRTVRSQNAWLLLASYVFYGWWDWRFLSLIWLSTAVDFHIARRLGACQEETMRRRFLLASVGINLGILATFKYFGFFVDSAAAVLHAIGLEPNPPLLEILLPVGISFYTFQTMSYTFDVYRRRMEPTDDLITFAVYVAYFPQLVAGPIERARHLLPQFQTARSPASREDMLRGLLLIARGLFRKVVIADTAALLANRAFASPGSVHWLVLAGGVLAFGVQIYGDFAGYTDVARGTSNLLGIHLVRNFDRPYAATTVTEFWRRWHISLSDWLRDYLYIPLGGNRHGRFATYRNLMLTMLLGGLWHGAAWTFVAWGGLHGLALAFERATRMDRAPASTFWRPLRWAATFSMVHLAWIFFRADSFVDAADIVTGILRFQSGEVRVEMLVLPVVLGFSWLLDTAELRWALHPDRARRILQRPGNVGFALGLSAAGLVAFSGRPAIPFIYFQF